MYEHAGLIAITSVALPAKSSTESEMDTLNSECPDSVTNMDPHDVLQDRPCEPRDDPDRVGMRIGYQLEERLGLPLKRRYRGGPQLFENMEPFEAGFDEIAQAKPFGVASTSHSVKVNKILRIGKNLVLN